MLKISKLSGELTSDDNLDIMVSVLVRLSEKEMLMSDEEKYVISIMYVDLLVR